MRIFEQIKNSLRTKFEFFWVVFAKVLSCMIGVVLLFKISEYLLESKPSQTSRKLRYFEKNRFSRI